MGLRYSRDKEKIYLYLNGRNIMETFILSDGGTLSYEKKGEGNALLFIHGLGAESSMYKPQIEYFSKKYQVIVPDLRGNGQSDELACSPAEVLDLQANDIVELLEHLDVKTVVVCGVHMVVSWQFI